MQEILIVEGILDLKESRSHPLLTDMNVKGNHVSDHIRWYISKHRNELNGKYIKIRLEVNDCEHGDAVKWNPENRVVQCHKCGQIFIPKEYKES
jgi:ribosomal protein S27E